MQEYLELIKKYLSLSLEDISHENYSSIAKIHQNNTEEREYDDLSKRIYILGDSKPFTGVMFVDDSDFRDNKNELCIRSQIFYFNGIKLGPEILDGRYSSNFGNWGYGKHGLGIGVNSRYSEKPNTTKGYGYGNKAVLPDWLYLDYFGIEFKSWYSERYDRLSTGFFDRFISERLTQENIIKEHEEGISSLLHGNDYIDIIKSINNFDKFLIDEMNDIKELFKNYKEINSISDCANLLFIFNPLFREKYEEDFQKSYIFDPENIEEEKIWREKQQKKKQYEIYKKNLKQILSKQNLILRTIGTSNNSPI